MKLAKVQSAGRKKTAASLNGRPTIDSPEKAIRLLDALEGQYPMLGNVPEHVRKDPRFRMLFQQWKLAGGKGNSPLVALMRSRWAFLTQEQFNAHREPDPVN